MRAKSIRAAIDRAYELGYSAGYREEVIECNPFSRNDNRPEYLEWIRGWKDGVKDLIHQSYLVTQRERERREAQEDYDAIKRASRFEWK